MIEVFAVFGVVYLLVFLILFVVSLTRKPVDKGDQSKWAEPYEETHKKAGKKK